jgi:hypothetical protein
MKMLVFTFAAVSLMLSATAALADMNLDASVSFDVVGTNLVVTLTNTSLADVLAPGHVLTGVFFDLPDGVTLTPVSALLGTGSTVFFGPDGGGNVGGEWAYAALTGPLAPANAGISSTGLGLFGNGNLGGSNLQGPASLDGLQYGITSAVDNPSTGNAAVTGGNALIKNRVVFTLSGIDAGFVPGTISNVGFQYGTSLNVIPAPAAALLGVIGLALVAWTRRRAA